MAIQKVTITEFIELAKANPVVDVRSPGEYNHAHIPGAFSLPLFTDEERKVVGTAYKQQSRQTAIKFGLDYFGVKMKKMVEEAEEITQGYLKNASNFRIAVPPLGGGGGVLVHCWRGGMRSAGVAWLLDLYGFKVYTLAGGYKAYRKWVREQFETDYNLNVLGGYTGSGKTAVLLELEKKGLAVIDLEALANHQGSAFGGLAEKPQPSQEMFENLLAEKLFHAAQFGPTWIEDESQRIGNLQIPMPFWNTMRSSPLYFTDLPFAERLHYLTEEYGKFEKEKLVNAIIRIQKRLGGMDTKMAINFLIENNHRECFSILLKYYDKWYSKGLYNRDNIKDQLVKIPFGTINIKAIADLLSQKNVADLSN